MWSSENHATAGSHVRVPIGTIVGGRYEIVGEAGCGNFARVYEARDVRSGLKVALKFMKPGYERDADFEVDVLTAVNKKDPSDTCGIVRFIERIRHQSYTALVFSLKGKSLRSVRLPLSKNDLRQVIRDVSSALGFLHDTCRAVHTDLKPENILAEISPSQRSWCICDFGSSSFYGAGLDHDLITTRPYRAPEVVLKRGWTYHADTWSLGCIIFEMFTGRKLFEAQSDSEHLEAIQCRLGPLPASFFAPRTLATFNRKFPPLKEELKHEPELLNLLEALLQYEPNKRLPCLEVPHHPFVSSSGKPTVIPFSQAPNAAVPLAKQEAGGIGSFSKDRPLSHISASTANLQPSLYRKQELTNRVSSAAFTRLASAPSLPKPTNFSAALSRAEYR